MDEQKNISIMQEEIHKMLNENYKTENGERYVKHLGKWVPVKIFEERANKEREEKTFLLRSIPMPEKEAVELDGKVFELNESLKSIIRNLPRLEGEAYLECRPAFIVIANEISRLQEKLGEDRIRGGVLESEERIKRYMDY